MDMDVPSTRWVYVIVKNPGADEQIVGQHDEQYDLSFIPVFLEKEAAIQGLVNIPCEKDHKYEIQAIIYEDLERYSAQNGFLIFILDMEGRVDKKIAPHGPKSKK